MRPAPASYTQLYSELAHNTSYLPERSSQYMFFNSLIRSLLQTVAFTAVEVLARRVDDLADTDVPSMANRMLRPTDGDTELFISLTLPLLGDAGTDIGARWFTPSPEEGSLRDRVAAWCAHRNSRAGHGVVAADVVEEALSWLPSLVNDLVSSLSSFLPLIQDDGSATVNIPSYRTSETVAIPTVRMHEGRPLVIRQLQRRGDRWRLQCQPLDPVHAPDLTLDLPECGFTHLTAETTSRYRQVTTVLGDGTSWRPTVLLPSRTTDTFEGRSAELIELRDWLDDPDSRACLLHGEGGFGKTTLTLEVLNRWLEGTEDDVRWRPDLICFFSAKLTRWGPDGLEYLRGVRTTIDDAVRTIANVYEDPLGRDWLSLSGMKLVDRTASLLHDLGIPRDFVLIVIDNAETIARSVDDEPRLREALELMTKKLGRVIITSRRRETIEARPIEVPRMTDPEGMRLLTRLAKAYDAGPILQAGDPKRRKLVVALGGSPIKLDACCRLIGKYGYALDRAQQQVLSNSDLSEFLYEDAWARIDLKHRIALSALAQMGDTLSGDLIHFLCTELQLDQSGLLQALEETSFATRFDYGTQYDVRLEASALSFFQSASQNLPFEAKARIQTAVAKASKRNSELLRAQGSSVSDRVAEAFRSDAAKAAKTAAMRGDVSDTIFWFEEAIKVEPGNAALVERFAFFLSARARDLDRAWLLAQEACHLDPESADAFFTAGHIAASRGDVRTADDRLQKALSLGMTHHRCELQMARARLKELEADISRTSARPNDLTTRLRDARRYSQKAALGAIDGQLDRKHQYEVDAVDQKLMSIAKRFRVASI